MRILVCGGNGAGKSTLARWLAENAGMHLMDVEHYYFQPRGDDPFAVERPRAEVARLLERDLRRFDHAVLAAVKADYGPAVTALLDAAVYLCVPHEIRMARVRARSAKRFGARALPGGDMHQREEAFFRIVEARDDNAVIRWLNTTDLPRVEMDGTLPPDVNGHRLLQLLAQSDLQNRLEYANIKDNPDEGGFAHEHP